DIFGEPFAELARYGLMSAAEQDKAAALAGKAKKSGNKTTFKGSTFQIPPGKVLQYTQKGYCMDPSLPAPSQGDAYTLEPTSDRVPAQLQQLYRKLGETPQSQLKSSKQGLTWTLMGAGNPNGYAA